MIRIQITSHFTDSSQHFIGISLALGQKRDLHQFRWKLVLWALFPGQRIFFSRILVYSYRVSLPVQSWSSVYEQQRLRPTNLSPCHHLPVEITLGCFCTCWKAWSLKFVRLFLSENNKLGEAVHSKVETMLWFKWALKCEDGQGSTRKSALPVESLKSG